MLGAFVLLFALTRTGAAGSQYARQFDDVAVDHWAYEAAGNLQSNGIIASYPGDDFGGRRTLTRSQSAETSKRSLAYVYHAIEDSNYSPC